MHFTCYIGLALVQRLTNGDLLEERSISCIISGLHTMFPLFQENR